MKECKNQLTVNRGVWISTALKNRVEWYRAGTVNIRPFKQVSGVHEGENQLTVDHVVWISTALENGVERLYRQPPWIVADRWGVREVAFGRRSRHDSSNLFVIVFYFLGLVTSTRGSGSVFVTSGKYRFETPFSWYLVSHCTSGRGRVFSLVTSVKYHFVTTFSWP